MSRLPQQKEVVGKDDINDGDELVLDEDEDVVESTRGSPCGLLLSVVLEKRGHGDH